MPVIHTPDTAYAQERRKHEANFTPYGPPGRPYVYQAYPAMLYKATRTEMGRVMFEGRVAASEVESRLLEAQGFVPDGREAAYNRLVAQEREIAKLAAERAHQERTMSPAAQAEAAAVDAATDRHVPVIPETPTNKKGQKSTTTKAQLATGEELI